MTRRRLWQRPVLRDDELHGHHRPVTWLELFFDLFFVVVIARIAHHLAAHPDPTGVLEFILLFVPVWWVWTGVTFYNERFETDGLENRLFAFLLMLPVAGMAVWSEQALGATWTPFVLSYATARGITAALFLRAGHHAPVFRPTSLRFSAGAAAGIAAALLSTQVEGQTARMIIFGVGLVLDVLLPFTAVAHQDELPPFSRSKLPERYGLFTIIMLGEAVVGVVAGLAEAGDPSPELLLDGVLGLALGFGLWWIYFDFVARRPFAGGNAVWAWGYLHLPLVMGIVATGAGITSAIGHAGDLGGDERLLIAGAVGTSLIAIGLLERTLERGPHEPTHPLLSPALKLITGVAAIVVGALGGAALPALLEILVGLLLINMAYGAWVWFTQELPPEGSGGGRDAQDHGANAGDAELEVAASDTAG